MIVKKSKIISKTSVRQIGNKQVGPNNIQLLVKMHHGNLVKDTAQGTLFTMIYQSQTSFNTSQMTQWQAQALL